MTLLKKILGKHYITVMKRIKKLIKSKNNIFIIFIFFAIEKNTNWVLNSHSLTIYPSVFDTKSPNKFIKVLNKESIFTHYTIEIGNSYAYSISLCCSFSLLIKKIIYSYKIFYNY